MAHHHRHQDEQEFESGLEVVAAPSPWRPNDIPLPEVVPYAHVDAKPALAPHVADDALAWNHYYKQNPGLEVAPVSPYSSAYGPGGQQHPPGYHHPSATPLSQRSLDADGQRKLCGVRRKLCYIVMAVAIVIAVAAIAIGVGVGLAVGRRSQGDSGDSTNLESTKNATITCPAKDNATFSAQDNPARHFRLLCGHDYNSADGAIDLSSQNTTTMAACIDLCAAHADCVGAGWGEYYGNRVCWMKSRLGEMNTSGNWLFAVDVNKAKV
ncbi:uncharacterized protein LY79DRAFT_668148 [Colletotrichum navitas]|uniref:Apple domain-containing protein n=1 Tax=Colletotrichum navitas TaxID=681940 RepID=A0AAD8Q520_9PEZI|nr:uncharacterized protein LY79DRAFT_668148 [Colletotrichum navitas]KAK1595376.1 hypothetical protein LY79DRAFT_668148 [Colletotrichum navitas]